MNAIAIQVQAYLIPALQRLLNEAAGVGVSIRFTSGYRSVARQRTLYTRYLASGKKGYPVAPPGRSYHNYGLAIDFTTRPTAALATVGRIAERLGFRWGGRFTNPDPIHLDTGGPYSEPG